MADKVNDEPSVRKAMLAAIDVRIAKAEATRNAASERARANPSARGEHAEASAALEEARACWIAAWVASGG